MAAKRKKLKAVGQKKGLSISSFSAAAANNKTKGKGQDGSSPSLFESRWTKSKFDILGKKRKSTGIRVGLSRSAAIEKRKKTLLQEFKNRGKTNLFLDRRFGEDNEALGEEDKAILRFQRERQAQLQKKNKFVLPDEEEEEAVLTHGGVELSNIADFQDILSEEDDEEGKELDEQLIREFHFGGFTDGDRSTGEDSTRPKSKKEIMEEVIAKSKFYKAQKAKEKLEDVELKEQLDKEFALLTQSQALSSLIRPKKVDLLKSYKKLSTSTSEGDEKPDDFDRLVKAMGLEMRAHATDRLKTEQELAEEEKARLEELEEKRKKRMLGDVDSEDSDEETDDKGSKTIKRSRLEVSGDDLGENFEMDDDEPKRGWVDDILDKRDAEEGSSEGDEEGSDDDEDAEEEDEDDDEGSSEGTEEDVSDEHDGAWERSDDDDEPAPVMDKKHTKDSQPKQALGVQELPFVIEAPKDLEEFKSLIDNRSIDDLLEVIERIRKSNSIHLAAENRRKMQVFYGVLLQYFAHVAGDNDPSMDRLNALVKPLIEMTSQTPYFAAVCARERIVRMRGQLISNLKNPGANGPWPSKRSLCLWRIWSMLFPTSDFRHVVMTPLILLMSEYLMRCPVNSTKELALGTFICALLQTIMRPAKRFCPEALSFLYATLFSALPNKKTSEKLHTHGCGKSMLELVASQPWLYLQTKCNRCDSIDELDFNEITTADRDAPAFQSDKSRLSIFNSALGTLSGFSQIYEDISCYPELFKPFVVLLVDLSSKKYFPQLLRASMKSVIEKMSKQIERHEMLRQPLRMRAKKPVPIKQYNPKFEDNFVRGRNYDPDRERAEKKKLQKLLKEEAKGAARELRKDNYFLQAEKAKEKAVFEEQREENYKKAMAFLQQQEAAYKSGQLGKGKKRRKK